MESGADDLCECVYARIVHGVVIHWIKGLAVNAKNRKVTHRAQLAWRDGTTELTAAPTAEPNRMDVHTVA